jgi:hypothetical protein
MYENNPSDLVINAANCAMQMVGKLTGQKQLNGYYNLLFKVKKTA